MILILSDKGDQHADRVESILRYNAAEYSRLNLDADSIKSTQVRMEDNFFRIEAPNCSFSTSEIEAVWNSSLHAEQIVEKNTPHNVHFSKWGKSWNKTLGGLFSSLESTKWLNFYPDFYNDNQFNQFAISKNTGLKWPSSICSNDINYLNSFFETKRERLLALMDQGCSGGFQEDCPGKCGDRFAVPFSNGSAEVKCGLTGSAYQVRCSVVGREYFVGKIKARVDADGHITAANANSFTEIHPPKMIKTRAIQIMTELNLTHGVFDFIVTESGEWRFDALNPIGKYQWIEDIRGSDISLSIAKWLMMNN